MKNDIAELVENGKAVVLNRKTKMELKEVVKVRYHSYIYYDEGRGSGYDGYTFYADSSLDTPVMNFDYVVPGLGVMIHSSLSGGNPYVEGAEDRIKTAEKYNERKELYRKARITPDTAFTIRY